MRLDSRTGSPRCHLFLSFDNFTIASAIGADCSTQVVDAAVFWICEVVWLLANLVLYLPPYLSRLHEKSLADIVATEERLLNYNSVDEERQWGSDDDD
eukprot:COSAG04_NODE_49_length_31209_cov_11.630248_21_plen_98_part_00